MLHQSPGSVFVRLDRGVFRADAVGDLQAFVAAMGRGYDPFCTEDLIRALEDAGDTAGVVFEEIGVVQRGG